jgi:tetratricopeptide (TPR) repeat protein
MSFPKFVVLLTIPCGIYEIRHHQRGVLLLQMRCTQRLLFPTAAFHPILHPRRIRSAAGLIPVLFASLCLTCMPTIAQNPMAGHDMGQMKEIPPPEQLPPPLKMTGIGNSHLSIKATPEAQMWFDQGLSLLHDFWDYESIRAFEQSIRVDPQCAMCYWGLYQALMFRTSQPTAWSEQAIAGAMRLKDHAGKHERLYIEAAGASNDALKAAAPGDDPDNEKEVAIWRRLVKESPTDLQAKIFLSESLHDGYEEDGQPKKGTMEAIAILEEVLKTAPNDSAANHYWIHAMEPSAHPEKALNSAALLASLAPASGHMVHMPGHIYYRVGNYAQAEHWFAESTTVDEKYMRDQHVNVDDDWNYVHNLMYSIANLMEEGKLQQATTLSAKLPGARGQLTETLYIRVPRDGYTRLDPQLPVALRTADWQAVLRMLEGAKPDARLENLTFLAGQLRQFANGMLALQNGNISGAQAASTALDAELFHMSQKVKDEPKPKKESTASPVLVPVMPDAKAAPLLASLSIMSLELRASILAEQKKLPEAKTLFAQAAREEKALGYREPPIYIRPVEEAEGYALLRAGDFAGAHKAYAAALVERPNSGFVLYGMARSSEAAGDSVTAKAEYTKFLEAWKNGDPGLVETTHAQDYLRGGKALASLSN